VVFFALSGFALSVPPVYFNFTFYLGFNFTHFRSDSKFQVQKQESQDKLYVFSLFFDIVKYLEKQE